MTDYEYPFRITDFHGEVVADELDTVPPLLTQEEIDLLAAHLEDTEITDTAVWSALQKLPDIEAGRGEVGDVRPHCQKCGAMIGADEGCKTAFGHFYHTSCLKMATDAKGQSAKREEQR